MTTEQMDEVDAMKDGPIPYGEAVALVNAGRAEVVDEAPDAPAPEPKTPAARPETGDHKAKKAKKPKLKVKTLTRVEKDDEGNETTVPYGREVTLHGVTVTVLDSALGDFETVDDLSLIGEAAEEYKALGEKADDELMDAAGNRVSPLLRRLVGYSGSRSVLAALRREHGTVRMDHVMEFIGELFNALSPNS